MITCTNCGRQNGDDSRICTSCGVHLWNESGPATGRPPEFASPPGAPAQQQWPAYTPPFQPQPMMVQPQQFVGFRCPFCQSTRPPFAMQKISSGGWVVFVVLLFLCFPLFWIGLLIKEDYRKCSSCGMNLG